MYSPSPVVHDVVHERDWPSPVERIARLLCRPLPSHVATGPYPFVSHRPSSLLGELSGSKLSHSAEEDDDFSATKSVTDVFDITLTTVCELRNLAQTNDSGYTRSTTPIWSSLIRTLVRVFSDHLSIMSDVQFIMPRMFPSEQSERVVTDGVARVLISCIINSIDGSTSEPSTGEMDFQLESHSTERSQSTQEEDIDEDVSINDTSESCSTTSSTPSINVPFDAHVLSGSGRRLFAVLPIICVADKDTIVPLLASVLYQRRVWGIDEPAVGIVFSKTGTVGRVYLAWLDQDHVDDRYLPTVHVACATSDLAPHPSLGHFDLTDPISALFFSQFVLGLESHASSIRLSALRPRINVLSWRSDDVAIDDQIMEGSGGGQWKDRVAHWARDVDSSDTSSDDSSFPRIPPPSLNLGQMPTTRSSKVRPTMDDILESDAIGSLPVSDIGAEALRTGRSLTRSSSNISRDGSKAKRAPSTKRSQSQDAAPSTSKATSSGEKKSHYSSSVLANFVARGLAKGLTVDTWLFERRVFTIACLLLPKEILGHEEVNRNIKLYDEFTNLLWPALWRELAALPQVDTCVRHLLKHFFLQYKEVCSRTAPDELDPAYTRIVSEHLSTLLSTCLGAFTFAAIARVRSVHEAEWRHNWDTLIYRFFVDIDEVISPHVLLERSLNFSRNNAADMEHKHLISSSETFALDYRRLSIRAELAVPAAVDAYTGAFRDDFERAVTDQTQAALNRAVSFHEDIQQALKKPIRMAKAIRKRAAVEPPTGICDAILFTAIPNALATGDAATYFKKFGFVRDSEIQESGPLEPPPALLRAPPKKELPQHKLEQKVLDNTLDVSRTESITSLSLDQAAELNIQVPDADALLLPELIVEYKKRDETATKALNQSRMYLVSGVQFLAALGIKDHPVFGLVTSGPKGGIIMAWHSSAEEKIYVIERNIRTFDLTSPIEAFQFATFLLRLRKRNEATKDLYRARQAELAKNAQNGQLPKWTKEAQREETKTQVNSLTSMLDEDEVVE